MRYLVICFLFASCGLSSINCDSYLCEVDNVLGTQVRSYHYKSYYNTIKVKDPFNATLARGTFYGLPGTIYPIQGQGSLENIRKGAKINYIGKSYQGGVVFELKNNNSEYNENWIMYTKEYPY